MNVNRPVSFDRIADVYDDTRNLPQEAMSKTVERLVSIFQEYDCHLILDAGMGTGRFADPLQRLGLHVIGIDVAEKMLSRARDKSVMNLCLGDVNKMPFRDKCFDAAMSVHVLHLIKDWRGMLTEIGRVTKHIYTSIVSIWPDDPWPGQVYEELLIKHGWSEGHPGLHERDLSGTIKPRIMKEVASFTQKKDANESLDRLHKRCYSLQWEVPEDIHQKVMAELRHEFEGKRLRSRAQVYLYVWDVHQLGSP